MKEPMLVLMCAGTSTRYGGGIKSLVRPIPNGPALIEYTLYDFQKAGGKDVILVIREETQPCFEEVFGLDDAKYNGLSIRYAYQEIPPGREKPKGTIDALLCAEPYVKDRNFIGCNGDDIYGHNAFKTLFESDPKEGIVTLGYLLKNCVPKEQSQGITRAILYTNESGQLQTCIEYEKLIWQNEDIFDLETQTKIDPNASGSMNILSISPSVFEIMQKVNAKQPYDKPDLMKAKWGRTEFLIPHFLSIVPELGIFCNVIPFDGEHYGVTTKEDIEMVAKKLKRDYPSHIWRNL